MGKPIQKKWFGDPTGLGYQIIINTVGGEDYILEQKGTRKYITNSNGIVFLVNKDTGLVAGEAFVKCRPFGANADGSEDEIVNKITQHRLVTFAGNSYNWTQTPAKTGDAELNPGIVQPFSATTLDIPDPENKGGSGYDKPSSEDDSGKCEGTDSSPIKDGWYSEDKIEKTTAEKAAQTPKRKAKAKAKEQSKPIEDLLAGLDNDSIEV